METASVIGLNKVENEAKISKGGSKQVANDASKEHQKKLIKDSDKPSLKKNSVDNILTDAKSLTKKIQNKKVTDVQVTVSN